MNYNMISIEEIKAIQQTTEDPLVRQLCVEHLRFVKSPYVHAYISKLKQLTYWDMELDSEPKSIDDCDGALKYLKEQTALMAGLDQLRRLMTPEEEKLITSQSDHVFDETRKLVEKDLLIKKQNAAAVPGED